MKLIEGTHYLRRLDQPSPHPIRAKELVDCLFCRLPSDSEDEGVRAKIRRKQAKDGIRLDKLMQHFKVQHKGDIPSEGRSLLDMGFTRDLGRLTVEMPQDAAMETEEIAEPSSIPTRIQLRHDLVVARTEQPPSRP